MKYVKIFLVALIMSLTLPVHANDEPTVYKAELVKIVDADTMDVTLNFGLGLKMDVRIRIRDYDAPETWRPQNEAEKSHGIAATEYAMVLLSNAFKVKAYKWAVFNRVEADIILADGRDFATVMKSKGYSKKSSY